MENVLFFELYIGLFEELVRTEIRYLRDFLNLMWYSSRSFAVTKVTSAGRRVLICEKAGFLM